MARPLKLTKAKKKRVAELIASGVTKIAASKAVGVGYSTLLRHQHDDADFASAIRDAEAEMCDRVVRVLYEKALSGNLPAIKYWLSNRWPDEWRG